MDEVNEGSRQQNSSQLTGAQAEGDGAMVPVDNANPDQVRKRQEQALMFEKYLEESGLSLSFQIVFTEIIQKQIPEDQVFAYTAMRLRQIGKELEKIDSKTAAPKN